jgi:hypothetical protein
MLALAVASCLVCPVPEFSQGQGGAGRGGAVQAPLQEAVAPSISGVVADGMHLPVRWGVDNGGNVQWECSGSPKNKAWRRRPDLNRGWRFCRAIPGPFSPIDDSHDHARTHITSIN